jgi:hypothetical protein
MEFAAVLIMFEATTSSLVEFLVVGWQALEYTG